MLSLVLAMTLAVSPQDVPAAEQRLQALQARLAHAPLAHRGFRCPDPLGSQESLDVQADYLAGRPVHLAWATPAGRVEIWADEAGHGVAVTDAFALAPGADASTTWYLVDGRALEVGLSDDPAYPDAPVRQVGWEGLERVAAYAVVFEDARRR